MTRRKYKKIIKAFLPMEEMLTHTLEGYGYEVLHNSAGQVYTGTLMGYDYKMLEDMVPKPYRKYYNGVATERIWGEEYKNGKYYCKPFKDYIIGLCLKFDK